MKLVFQENVLQTDFSALILYLHKPGKESKKDS